MSSSAHGVGKSFRFRALGNDNSLLGSVIGFPILEMTFPAFPSNSEKTSRYPLIGVTGGLISYKRGS
jgi:hypothetical protein